MMFEVFRGKIKLMQTEYVDCIPSRAELTEMQKSGHSFRINDKAASVQKVCEAVAEHKRNSQK